MAGKKIYKQETIQDKCRLCPKTTDQKYLNRIFGKNSVNLQEIILQICGIEVKETDYLPKVICRNCKTFLLKANDFRKECQLNQKKLNMVVSVKRGVSKSSSKLMEKESTKKFKSTATSRTQEKEKHINETIVVKNNPKEKKIFHQQN